MPPIPTARGPLSSHVLAALVDAPHALPARRDVAGPGDDFHLALYCCYELHYRGFDGVDPEWEWEPSLLALRSRLERRFEAELARDVGYRKVDPASVEIELWKLAGQDVGPSMSRHLAEHPSLQEFREFLIHRSAYHLKEADPHSWGIPRLEGRAKAAMIEIQSDEYGGGRVALMHSSLFRKTMEALGLDSGYGNYIDRLPGVTLATVNLMSLFGLHRRWRGALVGHLAMFEMTSTKPNRRYAAALRQLGFGQEATHFFDEHVLADAVHETVACHDLAASLAQDEPSLAGDIVFGARALGALDRRWASHLMGAWSAGRSSLWSALYQRVAV